MSRAEAFLTGVVQVAGPLQAVQENVVAVKLHPDAVSVMQLQPTVDEWKLDRIVTWALGKDIGRRPVEENYPYLVDQIRMVREEANIIGIDAGISIPANLFETRLLTLPYIPEDELEEETGFEGFWEEQDPELTNLDMKIVRYQVLYSNENDDKTVVLFSAIPEATVRRYIGLLIDADLMPVFVENEAFSLINGIYTRLDVEKLANPVLMLHLCPNSNMVIGFERNRVVMQKVDISEFDEALLLELEDIDTVDGPFWEEISIRVGEQVKQALAFLHEERDFPKLSKLHLISEHKNIQNMTDLLKDYVGSTRLVPWDALDAVEVPSDQARYVDYFRNSSVFTTALGLATQGINITGKSEDLRHRRLIDLNFLPDVRAIRRTRQFAALNKLLLVGISMLFVASFLLIGVANIPTLVSSNRAVKAYDDIASDAQSQNLRHAALTKKMKDLEASNKKLNNLVNPQGYTILMSSLSEMLPEQAELESLTVNENADLVITGYSRSTVAINQFAKNIIKKGLARKAPVTQSKSGNLFAFTITARLVARN
ncbi:MAG: PilN domain-containing protein [Parvibaculales bacterium]